MSTKPLDTAPALPAGCVDFNAFHDLVKKGDPEAAQKAVIVPDAEKAPPPLPAAPAKSSD